MRDSRGLAQTAHTASTTAPAPRIAFLPSYMYMMETHRLHHRAGAAHRCLVRVLRHLRVAVDLYM